MDNRPATKQDLAAHELLDTERFDRQEENFRFMRGRMDEIGGMVKDLWDDNNQHIGAVRQRKLFAAIGGYILNAMIAIVAAWAAVRGLEK